MTAQFICAEEPTLSYQRDIRPILAKNCFKCHGPDENAREAELRLDSFTGATADRDGAKAILPSKPEKSLLVERINSAHPYEVMPPKDSGLKLSEAERELLHKWIQSGAEFDQHWAFVSPQAPDVPAARDSDWVNNPIDNFVLKKLEANGLQPSPEADRYTLVRRVYLDLIGLPPSIEEADKFVNSTDPDAYEKLVEQLLNSPQYGERWARHWLDLARYADTNGYEKDRERSIWPYRDWVIKALNDDIPFDQFTIEQLAGDMLPAPTTDQLVATGFHRNTMLNEEGGIDPLEYRFHSMVDRVATTGTVWLGMTTGCAQCHTHKYDPITHTDYYAMFGLLNNADEPDLILPDVEIQKRRTHTQHEIEKLEAALPSQFPPMEGEGTTEELRAKNLGQQFHEWLKAQFANARDWKSVAPVKMSTNLPRLEVLADNSIFSTGDITKRDVFNLEFDLSQIEQPITALRLEVLPDDRLPARGPGRAFYEGRKGDFFLSELTARIADEEILFGESSNSFGKISIGNGNADAANVLDRDGSTGWSTATREGESHQLVLNFKEPLAAEFPLEIELLFERHFAASLGRFRFSFTSNNETTVASPLPVEVEVQLASVGIKELSDEIRNELTRHFLQLTPQLAEARKPIEALKKQLAEFPTTMIFGERPADNPRLTYRHHRGEYLQPQEQVKPSLPELFQSTTKVVPSNRLEFAKWLVSDENPLIGRVTVNRNWQEFFGRGLVRTSEDFGIQSSFPSHPELLDWLAVAFISDEDEQPLALNWSVKELHRLIVMSATYRQQSYVDQEQLQQDPENILLSRGPRFRLNAEIIRDSTLQASGLLHQKMGGPSVYPPQPGIVYSTAYGSPKWPISKGTDRYRRSLYTFTKRTAPFAAYTVFDAPTVENCIVRRDRSNTPLQALTMLNDGMFLEAAQAAAKKAFSANRPEEVIAEELFRSFLTRPPTQNELTTLLAFYHQQLERLQSNELDAKQFLPNEETPSPEIAAWVMVARVILNLDETVTKP